MRRITADYIFPGHAAPIKNGVICISDDGTILELSSKRNGQEQKFEGVICPGFVNVHCHTELSYAKGKIEEGGGIDVFITRLEKLKRRTSEEEKIKGIILALMEMEANGIVAVGDIMNTELSIIAKSKSQLDFYNFIEVFGSQAKDADMLWYKALSLYTKTDGLKNIVPHAPYSLSRDLFQKISDFQMQSKTLSMHHMESEGEAECFLKGTGTMADRFKSWGLELPNHIPSGQRPLPSIGHFLAQNDKVLLIHNTFVSQEDIQYAREHFSEVYYGLCPNANLFIEKKLPPVDLLKQEGVSVCLGTDSYASNHSLCILEEMKILEANFDISLEELIQWATLNGAKALGMENKLGSIEEGKKPGLVFLENLNSLGELKAASLKIL